MNTKKFLKKQYHFFSDHDISVWIFGGWAEEIQKMILPRPHNDIDFLYQAENFEKLDTLIQEKSLWEIIPKRLPHKRAVLIEGVMIEFILVQQKRSSMTTNFFGKYYYQWPTDVFLASEIANMRVVSSNILRQYRKDYPVVSKLSKDHFSP